MGPVPVGVSLYFYALAAITGASVGSFVNCAALRYARGESFARGRSRCPLCGRRLGAWELIPLVSYIALRGRCRACGGRISPRYPVTEAALAAAFVSAVWRYGISARTAECWLLFSLLLAAALIDLDTMEIPDGLEIAGAAVFLAFLPAHAGSAARLILGVLTSATLGFSLLALTLIMDSALGRESLGGGDIKLIAMLGLFTGPWEGLILVINSCVIGILMAIAGRVGDMEFPFAPSVALGAWVTVIFGEQFVERFLCLFK